MQDNFYSSYTIGLMLGIIICLISYIIIYKYTAYNSIINIVVDTEVINEIKDNTAQIKIDVDKIAKQLEIDLKD